MKVGIVAGLLVLIWSAIDPADRFTWWLEVAPVFIAAGVMAVSYRRFPLTPMLYGLILIHAIILMVGGHYTYAEVPLGEWWQQWFGWERNHYDKLGHFAQGFVPAMVARELMIRHQVVNGTRWMNFLIVSCCLAISAFYELLEWWAALFSGEAAEAFLGTQGWEWDTQSDMFLALLGAIAALLLLSSHHDRQLSRLNR